MNPNNLPEFTEINSSNSSSSTDPHPGENRRETEGSYYIPPIWSFSPAASPDPGLYFFQSGNLRCKKVDQGQSRCSLGDSLSQEESLSRLSSEASLFQFQPLNVSTNDCCFTTVDGQKIKVILQKELTESDVGSLGRITLPKIPSATFLPVHNVNEGTDVAIREVDSNKIWYMRFWLDEHSRMYVLEKTGDYVEKNRVKAGDVIMLFQDESKQLYIKVQNQWSSSAMEEFQRFFPIDNAKCDVTSSSGLQLGAEPLHFENMSLAGPDGTAVTHNNEDFTNLEDLGYIKVQNQWSSSAMEEFQRFFPIDNAKCDVTSSSGLQLGAEPLHFENMSLAGPDGTAVTHNNEDFTNLEDLGVIGDFDFSFYDVQ